MLQQTTSMKAGSVILPQITQIKKLLLLSNNEEVFKKIGADDENARLELLTARCVTMRKRVIFGQGQRVGLKQSHDIFRF